MIERFKKVMRPIVCHRAFYGGLTAAYGASCLGFDKDLIGIVVAAIYFGLTIRG